MENEEKAKELFKKVYGELIDPKYTDIQAEQLVAIAMSAVSQFAQNEGVSMEYLIK